MSLTTPVTSTTTGNQDITFDETSPVVSSIDHVSQIPICSNLANVLSMPEGFDVYGITYGKAGTTTTITKTITKSPVANAVSNLATQVLMDTVQWTTSQAQAANIAAYSFPTDYYSHLSDTFATSILRNYAYIRWDALILEVKLNTTGFHAGGFRILSTPMTSRDMTLTSDSQTDFIVPFNNSLVPPGEMFYACQANSVFIKLPFSQINNYVPLRRDSFDFEFHNCQQVLFRVISPLVTGPAADASCTLAVYVHLEGASVAVRSVFHELPITPALKFYDAEEKHLKKRLDDLLKHKAITFQADDEAGTAIAGAVTGGLQAFMGVASGNPIAAISGGIKAVSSLASLADNLDKPIYHAAGSVALHTTSPIAHGSGVESNINMGLTPSDTHMTPKDLLSDLDEMDLCKIAQIYGIVWFAPWNNTMAPGSIIATLPLTYSYAAYNQNATAGTDTYSAIPLTSVVNRFWAVKGSIKIRVTVFASSIHQGRFQLTFHPHITDPEPGLKNSTAPKNIVFQYNPMNPVFEWTIPFYYTRSWLRTRAAKTNMFNLNDGSGSFVNGYGVLTCTVATELTFTPTVAPNASLMFEMAGGPDKFCLSFSRMARFSY